MLRGRVRISSQSAREAPRAGDVVDDVALKTPTEHSRRTHRLVVTVSTMMFALLLSGCSLAREKACNSGEHAVKSIEAPETGRACARDGQPPPKGYEEFPPGQVPKYADQE